MCLSKKKFRVLISPRPHQKIYCLLLFIWQPHPHGKFLFPLLMHMDGLFSMESMTADMECTTIRVRGFLFCPPKGSLIQPQYFLIRCIFPDLKII